MRPRHAVGLAPLVLLTLVALLSCESDAPTEAPSPTPPAAPAPEAPTGSPPPEPVRIMPLGDSITQGDSDHDTYRRPLWLSLRAEGYEVDFVGSLRVNHRGPPPSRDFDLDHEGHWGFRVDEILDRVRGWAESGRPDVVLVHLGSNDVFQDESLSSTLEELRAVIQAIRGVRPECTFLLAQIIPTRNAGANRGIRELNDAIPELAGSLSTSVSPVLVVDQFTGFDAATQTYDGVHPNPAGEIHLSERWLASLREVLDR